MGARTGQQVIERLREHPRGIYYQGQHVDDVTTHPAFAHGGHSLARLYDLQYEYLDEMTYVSPSSGERVGLSFLTPRTRDDLPRVRAMMKRWADYSGGMMGRSPDYLNRSVMAYAAAADYMA
jgi:4-hydroxyphenylacetate 3-monooxygenase